MGNEIIHVERNDLAIRQYGEISVAEVTARRKKVVELMTASMTDGIDFGVIPGCPKPTLYQPGAQKLLNLFHLAPEFAREDDCVMEKDFILHSYRCTLYNIPTNLRVSSGIGSCNSREDKYGMRSAQRVCPECKKSAIIQGKQEYGGGFVCFKKKGGCGAKFEDDDPAITEQPSGKVPNENIWEQENTIRKMAQKRALVAACLNATGASDIFTQDVEDMPEFGGDAAGDKPMHREGHEHQTNFCKECQKIGLPAHCLALMSKGHIFLRDANHEPVDHEPFCPHPSCKKVYADQQFNQSATPATPQGPPVSQDKESLVVPLAASVKAAGANISEPQRKRMYAIYQQAGWKDAEVKSMLKRQYGIESSKDIPKEKYDEIIKILENGLEVQPIDWPDNPDAE